MYKLLLLFIGACPAYSYELNSLERVGIEVWQYERRTDPYFPYYSHPYDQNLGESWAYGAAFNVDVDYIRANKFSLFHRNHIHMGATSNQVREAGWKWELGIGYANKVELFYGHHSRHILDERPEPYAAYPLEDKYVLRYNFYTRDK